jgi:amino acid transporter
VFALAMGQIASAYPTAGGLYHWSSILGNRFTGWLTAWLNLLGLVTVLGAINVAPGGSFPAPSHRGSPGLTSTRRRPKGSTLRFSSS